MPGQNRTAAFPRHKGWWHDGINNRLVAVFNGTEIFDFDGNDVAIAQNAAMLGTLAVTGAQTLTGVTTHSAETRIAEGFNLRIGTISTFGTTEPTNAVVLKVGTNPVGAITTSGGIFVTTGGATISKIIADGTVSTIQT